MKLYSLIRSDYSRYRQYGGSFFGILFFTQGFWAILQYRCANAVHRNIRFAPLRAVLRLWMLCWQKTVEICTGISIPASVQIGPSFYIGHFGGIIINSGAVLGHHCNISQGVTIGVSGIGENRGVPILGDKVYIGANSVVAGKIRVGNDVLIGASSLVIKDVPHNSVVLGVPAVVISDKGSQGYI